MKCYRCQTPIRTPDQFACTGCGATLKPVRLLVRSNQSIRAGERVVLEWSLAAAESLADNAHPDGWQFEVEVSANGLPLEGNANLDDHLSSGQQSRRYRVQMFADTPGDLDLDFLVVLNGCWVARGTRHVRVEGSSSTFSPNIYISGHQAGEEAVVAGSQTLHLNVDGSSRREASPAEFAELSLELLVDRPELARPTRPRMRSLRLAVGDWGDWLIVACPDSQIGSQGERVFTVGRGADQSWMLSGRNPAETSSISRRQGVVRFTPAEVRWEQLSDVSVTEIDDVSVAAGAVRAFRNTSRMRFANFLDVETALVRDTADPRRLSRYRRWCYRQNVPYVPPVGGVAALRLTPADPSMAVSRCLLVQQAARLGAAADAAIRIPGDSGPFSPARIVYLGDQFWLEAILPDCVSRNSVVLSTEQLVPLEASTLLTIGTANLAVREVSYESVTTLTG